MCLPWADKDNTHNRKKMEVYLKAISKKNKNKNKRTEKNYAPDLHFIWDEFVDEKN